MWPTEVKYEVLALLLQESRFLSSRKTKFLCYLIEFTFYCWPFTSRNYIRIFNSEVLEFHEPTIPYWSFFIFLWTESSMTGEHLENILSHFGFCHLLRWQLPQLGFHVSVAFGGGIIQYFDRIHQETQSNFLFPSLVFGSIIKYIEYFSTPSCLHTTFWAFFAIPWSEKHLSIFN